MISMQELQALFASADAASLDETGVTLKVAILDGRATCTDTLSNAGTYKVVVGAAPTLIPTDGRPRFVKAYGETVDMSLADVSGGATAWDFEMMRFDASHSYVTGTTPAKGDSVEVSLKSLIGGSDELIAHFRVHDPMWAKNTRPRLLFRFGF